ncbi:hypothetical protein GO491_11825 [Flavobacteriaceae bacterium Ap0902]|nr:hypothetical protein [Flavobacteriaceae bacterium Ap0902]
MDRIKQINQLIEQNLRDDVLIYPDKHREVEHALNHASQRVQVESKLTDTSIVFSLHIPKDSLWDNQDLDGNDLKLNLSRKNTRTNKTESEVEILENVKISGGCTIIIPVRRADWEQIYLNSVEIIKSNNIINNLI